jgi:hypothetical protein
MPPRRRGSGERVGSPERRATGVRARGYSLRVAGALGGRPSPPGGSAKRDGGMGFAYLLETP